jgi:hypothetical protein
MKRQWIKITLLLAVCFVLGSGSALVLYATGNEAIAKGLLSGDKMYMVSHTEYRYDETGQIVVRLVNSAGSPISVDNCTAKILYPNKTIYLGPALMANTTAISGDHYYSFQTPANGPEGVYEYQALCSWNAGAKTDSATNSFHLSSAFNTLINSDNVEALSDAIFYYSFDTNGDMATSAVPSIRDLSPYLWDMTVLGNGGYTVMDAILGNAASTDSGTAYFQGPDGYSPNEYKKEWVEMAGTWSYNTWIKTSATNTMSIFAWINGAGNQSGFFYEPTTDIFVYYDDYAGYVEYNASGANFNNGSFHMLTLVRTGDAFTSADVYIDNNIVPLPKIISYDYNILTTGNYPGIGGRYYADSNTFDSIPDSGMIIDETGAWDFALTQAQRDKLYSKYNPYNDANKIISWVDRLGNGINMTITSGFNDLSTQINANTTQILNKLTAVNSSLSAQMNSNTTAILNALSTINVSVNLTQVLANQAVMQAYLIQINQTTIDTYTYMTGTLATNVNNILTQLGIINATLNRVETNTQNINSTVNQILQNQNDQVYMQVYSG